MLENKIFDFEECMYFVVDFYMYVKYIYVLKTNMNLLHVCFYSMYMYSVCIYISGKKNNHT